MDIHWPSHGTRSRDAPCSAALQDVSPGHVAKPHGGLHLAPNSLFEHRFSLEGRVQQLVAALGAREQLLEALPVHGTGREALQGVP